jgi:hypothetical protein
MRAGIRTVMIGAILCAMGVGCADKGTTPSIPAGEEYFPKTVGTMWEYETYRNRGGTEFIDTVTRQVQDTITLQNGLHCTIWMTGSDTTFVHARGDSVVIFDLLHYWDGSILRDTFMLSQRFSFPLHVGKVWLNRDPWDSLFVEAEEILEVFPGDFRRAFRIVERNHGWCYVDYQCWLVSGLGMVRMRSEFACDTIGYETRMRLLRFKAP